MQHADPQSGVSTTLAPLRNLAFWTGSQISSLGWLVQTVAISWMVATVRASPLPREKMAADKHLDEQFQALHDGEGPPQTVLSVERTAEAARTRPIEVVSRPLR